MRRRLKQGLACILAVMTIVTALPADIVYGAETVDQVVSDSVENEEISDGIGGQEEQNTDSTEMQLIDDSDSQESAQVSADTGESGVLEDSTDIVAQSDEADSQEALINYVAVDAGRIELGGTQNIVIGLGNESQIITDAVLGYQRKSDGSIYEAAAATINGNALLFSMEYATQDQKGEYVLDFLTYTLGGNSYSIRFADIGMDIRYGVGVDVTCTPDAMVVDESEEAMEMDIVTFDENGQPTSENSIADAIENQRKDGIARSKYNGNLVVVLDPGHDGVHAGAQQGGLSEEQINLKIAQYCKEELEQYQGVTVYMTVTSNACPYGGSSITSGKCNESRVAYAQSVGADVYVALHNNSAGASASGSLIYYPNANYNSLLHQQGEELAQSILDQLVALGLKDMGILVRDCKDQTPEYQYPDGSQADYYAVIRNCKRAGIPALIVEHAFMTNASDVSNFLNSDEKLKKLGVADATGIAQYYGLSKESTYDYSAVFDPIYYADYYPDLKGAFGYDEAKLLAHFINYGMSEARRGCAAFDVRSYRNANVDLRRSFGNDWTKYYIHYIEHGQYENRVTTGVPTMLNATTVYGGVDYRAVYDYNYYIKNYPDINQIYGGDDAKILEYFVLYGMAQGQQANAAFDVKSYRNAYSDLRMIYGNDWKSYYLHYVNYGKNEGRVTTGVTSLRNPVTVYNGVDYSTVYDFNEYISRYSDIRPIYENDDVGALRHFVEHGMSEARRGNAAFDVKSYRNAYSDLRMTYGNDWKSYYLHYMNYGKSEGRITTGVTSLRNPVTVYNGVDYSAVYNFNDYISRYSDMRQLYKDDDIGAIRHFVEHGMSESRRGNETFDVVSYINAYRDLRMSFGANKPAYYRHYMNYGKAEHRVCSGVPTLQNAVTIYQGVDYAPVYDYNYYLNKYPTLKQQFMGDETATLQYFVEYGMSEGHHASAGFDVQIYRSNYSDLRNNFGDALKFYYIHYIQDGRQEGRNATTRIYCNIMRTPTTTVSQMVRYFNSKAEYPAFYVSSDAPNIETFCQIFYEECVTEGVDPAVAFCQSMKETGFLRFGGQVQIEQYNFAGLGALDSGEAGATFPNVRTGIRAQVQHLKAYASEEDLNQENVDPRFQYVSRGCAPYVEWLGQKENPLGKGWATAPGYGNSIVNDYMARLYQF